MKCIVSFSIWSETLFNQAKEKVTYSENKRSRFPQGRFVRYMELNCQGLGFCCESFLIMIQSYLFSLIIGDPKALCAHIGVSFYQKNT